MSGFRFSPEERAAVEREAEAHVLQVAMTHGESLDAIELHAAIELHVRAAEVITGMFEDFNRGEGPPPIGLLRSPAFLTETPRRA